ncbi:B box-type domain-containing protein [Abeliophyllum distichum]|uniref:B box-type domain-containing protein n=1 Tax=Abeliophyllum distichum TaxID=126358 RepID=A0ABD1PRJ6_9LAMI
MERGVEDNGARGVDLRILSQRDYIVIGGDIESPRSWWMPPTSRKAAGLKLGPTISICHTCAQNQVTTQRKNWDEEDKDEDGDSQKCETDGEEYYSDSNGYDYVEDREEEEDGKNQVGSWSNSSYTPTSPLPPPLVVSSSSTDANNVSFTSFKRMRDNSFESEVHYFSLFCVCKKDEDECCSSQVESKFVASNLTSNSFRPLKLQMANTIREEAPIKSRTVAIIGSLRRSQ